MAWLLILAFLLLTPGAAFSQSYRRLHPYCVTNLGRAELVAPGVGWAIVHDTAARPPSSSGCASPRLYWTDSSGQSWRDISPLHMPVSDDPLVFFLDRSHGWVLSVETIDGEQEPQSYLLSTEDAGTTWRTSLVKWPRLMDVQFTRPTQVFFADTRHGWIVWEWHTMHSYQHALLATEDGGATWKQLPDPPSSGRLQFTSAREGWMIGPPRTRFGIPTPNDEKMLFTNDGGVHWRAIAVPIPADPDNGEAFFTGLHFTDSRHGLVVAEREISGYGFQAFTCVTDDGGQSWSITSFEAYQATPSFVGREIIWSIFDQTNGGPTIRSGEHVTTPALVDGQPLKGHLRDVGFRDHSNGWTIYDHDERSDLVATTDGGATFSSISPPVVAQAPLPPPEISGLTGINGPARTAFKHAGPMSAPAPVPAGGTLILFGIGFLPENTIRIGDRTIQASLEKGPGLRCSVPVDMTPGVYEVTLENGRGTSNAVQVEIRPPVPLVIRELSGRDPRQTAEQRFHPGQMVWIKGTGFLQENTFWFGNQQVPVARPGEGYNILHFVVPTTLSPGDYDVYFTNAAGKSNVIRIHIE